MRRRILARLGSSVIVLFLVTVVVFSLAQLGEGSAARAAAGGIEATQADIAAAEERLGLNRPVLVQYADWASGLLRGDLGESYVSGQPVVSMLADRIEVTLVLTVLSVALGGVLAIVVGTLAASRPAGLLDRVLTLVASVGIATPPFVIALALLAVVAVNAALLPATGYVSFTEAPGEWAMHLILPVATVTVGLAAELSRYVRASVRDVLESDYITLLEAQGFGRPTVLFRSALKCAAVPFTTVIGLQISHLLGGIVVVETIFAMPGLGWLAVRSVLSSDVPVMAGVAILVAVLIMIVNLCVDLAHMVLDPRVVVA